MATSFVDLNLKLASAAEDVKIWSLDVSTPCHRISTNALNFQSVHWSFDLQKLISVPVKSQHLTLIKLKSDKPEITDLPIKHEATYARFSNKSSVTIGVGSKRGTVLLWDLKHMKPLKSFSTDKTETTSLCFNGNNSYLASGTATGQIFLHNTTSGQSNPPFGHNKGSVVQDLHYSNFQKSILGAGYYDGMVTMWDVNTRQVVHNFNSHNAPATGVRFSHQNPHLFISVGLDKGVFFYDASSKTVPKSFTCEYPVSCFDFNEDGHTLALGCSRGKILMYDLRFLNAPKVVLTAHTTSINCLAFQSSQCENPSKSKKVGAVKTDVSSISGASSSVVSKDLTGPSLSELDLEPSFGKSRVSYTFDVFSPVGDGLPSSRPSEVSDIFPIKKLAQRDSLAVFSPLDESRGLNDAASCESFGSPSLRTRPSLLSRVFESPLSAGACSPIVPNKLNNSAPNSQPLSPANISQAESPTSSKNRSPKWPSEKTENKLHCMPDMSCLSLRGICSTNTGKIIRNDMLPSSANSSTTVIHNNTAQVVQPVTMNSPTAEFRNSVNGMPVDIGSQNGFSKVQVADDEGHGTGVGTTPITPEAFQSEYIRQCVEDAKEELLDESRKIFHFQHVNLCREIEMLKTYIRKMMESNMPNVDLVSEIETLRSENEMLRRLYH